MSNLKKQAKTKYEIYQKIRQLYDINTEISFKQRQHISEELLIPLNVAQKEITNLKLSQQNYDSLKELLDRQAKLFLKDKQKLEAENKQLKENEKNQILMKCEGCFSNPAYAKYENKQLKKQIAEADKILDKIIMAERNGIQTSVNSEAIKRLQMVLK